MHDRRMTLILLLLEGDVFLFFFGSWATLPRCWSTMQLAAPIVAPLTHTGEPDSPFAGICSARIQTFNGRHRVEAVKILLGWNQ